MKLMNDWIEQIFKYFVCFLIGCINTNWIFLIVNSTLNTKLNFPSKMSCSLFHSRPDFFIHAFLQQWMAVSIKLWIVHKRNFLRERTFNLNSILSQFFLCYKVWNVLYLIVKSAYHEDEGLLILSMNKCVDHFTHNFLNAVLINIFFSFSLCFV